MGQPFASDLHALLAGAVTAALDLGGLERALAPRRHITVSPQADEEGNFQPEWEIRMTRPPEAGEDAVFRLRLEQEAGA